MHATESSATFSPPVRGACPHDCPDTCALLTTVEGGVAVRVQGNPLHAHTAGTLCTKVSRYAERSHHPDRVLTPLKRSGPKGSGQFTPVSWDQALDDIAARLRALPDPQAVLPYSYAGTMGLVQGEAMAGRFFNRLGASQLDRTICASAGGEGLTQTLGGKVGMKVEHFADSQLILIWGSNSIGSNLHFWRHAQEAKRRGAQLVCIDPRRSETADKCQTHLQLMPGTATEMQCADPFDPRDNIIAGTKLLRLLSNRYNGDINLVLAAYNAGPGNVAKANGIPFEETRAYVENVYAAYQRFLAAERQP